MADLSFQNNINIDELKNHYLNWVKEKTKFRQLEGAVEITSPLLDRNNDYLRIFATVQGDNIKLTDDGYIIDELEMSGNDVDSSPRKKELLNGILNGLGVRRGENNELFVITNQKDFPMRKHMLLQAMINVNDMFFTSRSNVKALFWEDIHDFLFDNDIPFNENISFIGKSGFNQKFDFLIPRTKKSGEKIVQTMNNPNKTNLSALLFQWEDVRLNRKPDSRLFAFLNDSDTKGIKNIVQACLQYEITPLLWSERSEALKQLSA